MNQMRMGFRISAPAMAAAAEGGAGRRNMSSVLKALGEYRGKDKRAKTHHKPRKASSELRTFLGIPHESRKEIALIISKFIKLYNSRSPCATAKQEETWEKNFETLLRGKNSIGFPEVARILSPEFTQGQINVKDSNMDSFTDNTKGKGSQKKGKSSKK